MSKTMYSYEIVYVVDGKQKRVDAPFRLPNKKLMQDHMKQKIKDLHWENRKNDFRIVSKEIRRNLPALEAMLRL